MTLVTIYNENYCVSLQDELDETAATWNHHKIRPIKHQNTPSGRPVIMYDIPSLYGSQDYLVPVTSDEIQPCKHACVFRKASPVDPDVDEACVRIMHEQNIAIPGSPNQAKRLYLYLRNEISRSLGLM